MQYSLCFTENILSHLKDHLRNGNCITCPFRDCKKLFTKGKSFTSHLSRLHKNCILQECKQMAVTKQNETQPSDEFFLLINNETSNEKIKLENTDDNKIDPESLLKHMGSFFLKLEIKCLVPKSAVQSIAKELSGMLAIGRDMFCIDIYLRTKCISNLNSVLFINCLNNLFITIPCISHIINSLFNQKINYLYGYCIIIHN